MSFLDKIRSTLLGENPSTAPTRKVENIFPNTKNVKHEYVNFSNAYRIGILCFLYDYESQKPVHDYKKKLEQLGFECEVLLFTNKLEKDAQVYLTSFGYAELNKEGIPTSPRTDRFTIRRFDILLNLFFNPCPQLLHIARSSNAKCRVSPFLDHFTNATDVFIPLNEQYEIPFLIEQINKTLDLKPYVRQEI